MKIAQPPTFHSYNEELFEKRFDWMISKVLGGALLFFALAMTAQWENFRGASPSYSKVQTARRVIALNVITVAFSPSKKENRDAAATSTM